MNLCPLGAAADETQPAHRLLRLWCQQKGPKGAGDILHLSGCGDQVDRRLQGMRGGLDVRWRHLLTAAQAHLDQGVLCDLIGAYRQTTWGAYAFRRHRSGCI